MNAGPSPQKVATLARFLYERDALGASARAMSWAGLPEHTQAQWKSKALDVIQWFEAVAAERNGDAAERSWEVPVAPVDVVAVRDQDGNVWYPHPDKLGVWHRRPTQPHPETLQWVEREWNSLLAYVGRVVEVRETEFEAALRRIQERNDLPNSPVGLDMAAWHDILTVVKHVGNTIRQAAKATR